MARTKQTARKTGTDENASSFIPEPPKENVQWAQRVISFSSEHPKSPSSSCLGKKNENKQETKENNKYTVGWSPSSENGTEEFLEVSINKELKVSEIRILESYNPGAIVKISARKENGDPWVELWWRPQGPECLDSFRVFSPLLTFPKPDFEIKEVRLDVDLRRNCKGYQIEGIQVIGADAEKFQPIKMSQKILQDKSLLSDANLIFEDKKYPTHKMICGSHSSKLYHSFLNKNEVVIKDTTLDLFKKVYDYLYTGTIGIDENKIEEYMALADQLGLRKLMVETSALFLSSLSVETVIPTVIKAYKKEYKFDPSEIIQLCLKFVEDKCHDVIDVEAWNDIPAPFMKDLLRSSRLVVDELDLFNGLRRWGKTHKDELPEFAKLIRYPQISLDDLKSVIKNSELCPKDLFEEAIDFHKNGTKYAKRTELQFQSRGMVLFGSKILTPGQASMILKWVNDVSSGKKWKLAYQATRDGFDTTKFHVLSDKFKESIVVIKSENNNIFGAYAAESWAGSGYSNNSKTFLYSVVNSINSPQILKSKGSSNETYRYNSYGPTFGSGHDLYICTNSNTTNSSYTNLPYSFNGPQGFTGAHNTFLAGSYNFKTKEIEVFGLEK